MSGGDRALGDAVWDHLDLTKMSLRDAARATQYDVAYLSRVLKGKQRASRSLVEALDKLCDAGGSFLELAGFLDDDEHARLEHGRNNPTKLDLAAVGSLAEILAAQRRADDRLPPTVLKAGAEANAVEMRRLLREARGKPAKALAEVAAEATQFSGWLHAELRNDATALRHLNKSLRMAKEIENGPLTAQALNFQAYVARQQRRPADFARLFEAAYRTPHATAAQRMGDAAQAVQGLVETGRREEGLRLLDEALDLKDQAEREEPPGTAYWLTGNFQRLNLGIAYLSLGRAHDAASNISEALEALPAEQKHAEWTTEHRDVLARAKEQL